MRGSILLGLLLIWGQESMQTIRNVKLSAPAHAAVGKEAIFGCQYEMDGDLLYSVKWYKDNREIFRYLPRLTLGEYLMDFPSKGVHVDLSRSSTEVMVLTNLQRESAGLYYCEVTGEAPTFVNAANAKYLDIYDLPKSNPRITGLKSKYDIGDQVSANCTSSGSRPSATIKWLVNNKTDPLAFLSGPWHKVVQDPQDATETTLGLSFIVQPNHYKSGVMEIKCQVTIPPLYQKEEKQWFTRIPKIREPETEQHPEEYSFESSLPRPCHVTIPPLHQREEKESFTRIPKITESEPEQYPEEYYIESSPEPPNTLLVDDEDISVEEDDLPDEIRHDAIKAIFNKLNNNKLDNKPYLEVPTTSPATIAEVPKNTTDFATITGKSLRVMVLTLLIQLILV